MSVRIRGSLLVVLALAAGCGGLTEAPDAIAFQDVMGSWEFARVGTTCVPQGIGLNITAEKPAAEQGFLDFEGRWSGSGDATPRALAGSVRRADGLALHIVLGAQLLLHGSIENGIAVVEYQDAATRCFGPMRGVRVNPMGD